MIPIPDKQQGLLRSGNAGNFSLVFPRLVNWKEDGDKLEPKYNSDRRDKHNRPIQDSSIVELGKIGNEMIPKAKDVLDKVHERQVAILQEQLRLGTLIFEFHAKLASPYISGLGSGHPTETGMILDRNTGVPFIPASGIKGVLRLAHALNLVASGSAAVEQNQKGEYEISDKEPTLRKYFGDTDTRPGCVRGQIVFLDAYPATPPTLKTDIMNPHFGKYYRGEQPPLETESPIPIKFLSVKERTEFIFRCFVSSFGKVDIYNDVSRDFDDSDKNAIKAMFKRALEQLGLGGKTAIGYGRFEIITSQQKEGTVSKELPSEIWENASLTWIPGSQTLKAEKDGKKTELKLGQDKSIIPETLRQKLIDKRKTVNANIAVEVDGNAFKITKVE